MKSDFKTRLAAGETLLGTMLTFPCPSSAEILAHSGFDWLFIDGEHGPLETSDILSILQAVGDRAACIVRVPDGSDVGIKKVLDLGADGVIVPQVNTAVTAQDVVRSAKYAPLGARGVGLARAHGYGLRFQQYMESANEQTAVIVQAEHIQAVENIDDIVRVPGVDAILLGPYDLSASLGKIGQIDDPEVTAAIDRVVTACRDVGMPLGYFGVSAAAVRPYMKQGCRLIVAGVDSTLLAGSAAALLKELKS